MNRHFGKKWFAEILVLKFIIFVLNFIAIFTVSILFDLMMWVVELHNVHNMYCYY